MKEPPLAPRGRDYLHLLMSKWIVIVCATALSAVGGWIAWETGDRVYVSTSQVIVTKPGGAMPPDAFYGDFHAKAAMSNYVVLAKSEQVTMRTIEQLRLEQTPEELADDITVGSSGTSVLLQISVTGDDPYRTTETANAVTASLIQLSREMSAVNTAGTELVLIDPASPPTRQGSLKRNLIWSTSLGLGSSVVLVLTVGLLRGRVLGRGQVAHVVRTQIRRRRS
jgi:capsular polysaccharide biosynthesis protein